MARTFRRVEFARRWIANDEVWDRSADGIGLRRYTWGPRQIAATPAWELMSDNWGSDSRKKGEPIKTHRRSVRRFVHDTLAKGMEPVVCNDKQSWYCCDGVEGIALPIDTETGDS